MKDWFTLNLGDGMFADEPLENLRKKLLHLDQFASNKNVAAYFRHESEGSLHCNVKVYLTPNTANIAEMIEAKTCVKPSPEGLSLLAGSSLAWKTFFPDYDYLKIMIAKSYDF